MKTKKLKGLKLNKESITSFETENLKGGHGCPTHTCYCHYTKIRGNTVCAI
jgi:hypothetical protein